MCIQPLTLADRIVPCGKCYYCKLRRVNGWVLRLQEQDKISSCSYFITLTYENETNDKDSDVARITKRGLRTLVKRDLQLFFKRLRYFSKEHGRVCIKYYACGEYGTKSGRPHYHAIVFNALPEDIRASWIHGFVHVGTVTSSSIAYCLKYIAKGRVVPEFDGDDRQKEFSVMSKGLGANYLTPAMVAWHRADPVGRSCATREGGFKFPLPRYLNERIFNNEEKAQIQKHYEEKFIEEMCAMYDGFTPALFQKWKKEKRDIVDSSYRMMEYLAKENQKV